MFWLLNLTFQKRKPQGRYKLEGLSGWLCIWCWIGPFGCWSWLQSKNKKLIRRMDLTEATWFRSFYNHNRSSASQVINVHIHVSKFLKKKRKKKKIWSYYLEKIYGAPLNGINLHRWNMWFKIFQNYFIINYILWDRYKIKSELLISVVQIYITTSAVYSNLSLLFVHFH